MKITNNRKLNWRRKKWSNLFMMEEEKSAYVCTLKRSRQKEYNLLAKVQCFHTNTFIFARQKKNQQNKRFHSRFRHLIIIINIWWNWV